MIVITGASASGKTEVAKFLAKKYAITKAITTTTREKRVGEENGRDYFFISKEDFEKMIRQGKFVEYTIFNGNYYGSTKDQIAEDKCVVTDLAGLRSYTDLKDKFHITTFYLNTDEATRLARMKERGDEPDKIASRIANDREIFDPAYLPEVDFTLESDAHHSIEQLADEIVRLYQK